MTIEVDMRSDECGRHGFHLRGVDDAAASNYAIAAALFQINETLEKFVGLAEYELERRDGH